MEKVWNFDFSCSPRMTLEEPDVVVVIEVVGKEPEHRMGLQWFYKHDNQIGRGATRSGRSVESGDDGSEPDIVIVLRLCFVSTLPGLTT